MTTTNPDTVLAAPAHRRGRFPRGEGRAALVAATQQVIAARGIERVRMRSIAAQAGLSIGSATYHFHDRADMIYDALCDHTDTIEFLADTAITATAAGDRMGGVQHALVGIYADRDRAVVTTELRAHSVRSPHARLLAQRLHTALHTMLTRAGGLTPRRAQRLITELDTAVIELAAEHTGGPAYAGAMRQRIATVLGAR